MPWLVLVFGIMIVPLGVVSITFVIIQPIVIGTWSTLALIGAAAMLVQIPYSFDELVATSEFLWRRRRAGRPIGRVLLFGDTDEGEDGAGEGGAEEFDQGPRAILRDMWTGGVTVPWTLAASMAIGVWLMLTRLTLGAEDRVADMDHLMGALVLSVTVTATAEVARAVRLLDIPLGLALLVLPFLLGPSWAQAISSWACGAALIGLAIPRGTIHNRYGLAGRLVI